MTQVEIKRTTAEVDIITAWVEKVDHVATELEHKWGVGRLPLLVDPEWRVKFERQAKKYNHAVWNEPVHLVEAHGGAMIRAWQKLDELAEKSGASTIAPDVWEVALSDGRVVAIMKTGPEATAEIRSGRHVECYTLDELARLIEGFPTVAKAKQIFPGSKITHAGPPIDFDDPLDDPLPPNMLEAG